MPARALAVPYLDGRPNRVGDSSIKQRMAGDYITCRTYVGPRDAAEMGRHPGFCNALIWLEDGGFPERCPYNHVVPVFGTGITDAP